MTAKFLVPSADPGHHRTRSPGRVTDRAVTMPRIPDLLQWYDAGAETAYADTNHVTTIPDRSGNGNDLTGGTGPQWRSAANGIGGYPAYQFTAGTEEMVAASRVVPLSGFALFFVMNYSSGRPLGLEDSGSGTNGLGFYNGGWIIRNSGASYDLAPNIPTTGVFCLRMGTVRGAEAYHSGWASRNVSGTQWSDAGKTFHLGSAGTADNDLNGKIAEYVSFSRELSDEEWGLMIGWLRGKYGV